MSKLRRKRISFIARLRNYFITGVVVLIPIGFTLYLSKILIGISSNLIPSNINPNSYLPFKFNKKSKDFKQYKVDILKNYKSNN